jgi:hypothetical protein
MTAFFRRDHTKCRTLLVGKTDGLHCWIQRECAEPYAREEVLESGFSRLLSKTGPGATWKEGVLEIQFCQPFDMLIDAVAIVEAKHTARQKSRTENLSLSNSARDTNETPDSVLAGRFEDWLPDMDSNHD